MMAMNFDPIGYCISRQDQLEERVRTLEGHSEDQEHTKGRVMALEVWRASWDEKISKWPYALWLAILIGLNIAPEKTVSAVIDIIKAAL